ncbi:hypothetical protein E8E11_009603 [Didymella keratinophila]|nr:hypothetical protein E8E11_009603 [Didymella keratinophila]
MGVIATSTGVLARLPDLLLCNTTEFASFPPPNYANPTTLRPLAIGVITPMTVLVVAFMSCRIYSRTVLTKTLGWDDGIMLLAVITSVGNNIMVIISMLPQYRMGHHLWDIPPQLLYGTMKAAQMGMSTQLLFTAIITLMKVAILLTYLPCFFVTLFQCAPASTYWNIFKYIGRAKCLNIKAIYYFHSGQNTFSEFLIFLWPAKDLLNVKVSLRQRVTLTCMFSLGVIVCGAGVARLYYTHMYLESYDVFWQGVALYKAERGVTIRTLEVLSRSQTLASTLKACVSYRSFELWSLLLVILWSLSPAGGQAGTASNNLMSAIPGILPALHAMSQTPLEAWLADPMTGGVEDPKTGRNGITDQYTCLPPGVFDAPFTVMFNTIPRASYRTDIVLGKDGTDSTNYTFDGEAAHPDRFGNTTGQWLSFSHPVYRVHVGWLALYLLSIAVMFVSAIATVFLRMRLRAPDVLDSASAFPRDSQYVRVPPGGSTLDGIQMARALGSKRIRSGVIRPDDEVGQIAFAEADMVRARVLRKDLLYM